MPEKITASILEKPTPNETEHFQYSAEAISQLNSTILDFLEANHLHPDDVLFAGYDADTAKESNDEHMFNEEMPIFYFGDTRSLSPPEWMSDSEELQEEHWMVNPLQYAIPLGTLGVYNKHVLDELAGGPIDQDPAELDEFGTYAYVIDSATLEHAKIAELTL